MGDRTNIIIGLILLAAIVAFVFELCDSGPIQQTSTEADVGMTSPVLVPTPQLAPEAELLEAEGTAQSPTLPVSYDGTGQLPTPAVSIEGTGVTPTLPDEQEPQ